MLPYSACEVICLSYVHLAVDGARNCVYMHLLMSGIIVAKVYLLGCPCHVLCCPFGLGSLLLDS